MKSTSRGRPLKNNNVITINDLTTQYLSTKKDKYDNETVYFKIVDNRQKLKSLFEVNDKEGGLLKFPFWLTPEEETILKVKSKWMNISDELIPQETYNLNIDFTSYTLEVNEKTIKGYYAKISKVKKSKSVLENIEIDISN